MVFRALASNLDFSVYSCVNIKEMDLADTNYAYIAVLLTDYPYSIYTQNTATQAPVVPNSNIPLVVNAAGTEQTTISFSGTDTAYYSADYVWPYHYYPYPYNE